MTTLTRLVLISLILLSCTSHHAFSSLEGRGRDTFDRQRVFQIYWSNTDGKQAEAYTFHVECGAAPLIFTWDGFGPAKYEVGSSPGVLAYKDGVPVSPGGVCGHLYFGTRGGVPTPHSVEILCHLFIDDEMSFSKEAPSLPAKGTYVFDKLSTSKEAPDRPQCRLTGVVEK